MKIGLSKKDIIIILIAGVLAAVVNLFRLPLFFEAEFVFGPFLVLLVAVFRGPLVGLGTSLIATIPLVYAWGSYWPTLTFGLEALVVGFICFHKRYNVILVVMCFWIFIGIPISWYSISQYELFIDSHRTSILIKQLTNAIIYAHIAAMLMYLPIIKRFFNDDLSQKALSLKKHSSHIISSLLITIGVGFFFINLNQNIKNSNEKFESAHAAKHEILTSRLQLLLEEKIRSLEEIKYSFSNVWGDSEKLEKELIAFNERHDSFRTMLIANADGNLIHSSPPELVKNVIIQGESINITDRDYFKNAIKSQTTFVSPGFLGRGFGKDLISAVSIGIPNENDPETNVGVVEGSFILYSMKHVQKLLNNVDPTVDAVLLDQNNNFLLGSDNLNLERLSKIEFVQAVDTIYKHELVNILLPDESHSKEAYYISESKFNWGWKLVTLQNEAKFADVIESTLVGFAVSIVMVVLISYLLALLISQSWSYYMQRLNQLIESGVNFEGDLAEFEANEYLPAEVSNLYQEIKSSRLEIIKMNHELQNTVAERTEKLQVVNKRLNIMAREDALTKLNNRHVFNESLNSLWSECQKSLLPLSMLIIDIDHFKHINDTYGHPVGDDVLIQVAAQLQCFKNNRIDCLARIGGEEFCVLLKGSELEYAEQLAEKIRKHIESFEFHVGIDKHIKVTVSVGVACIDATKFTSSKLYQLADNALYEAKHSGRNQTNCKELS